MNLKPETRNLKPETTETLNLHPKLPGVRIDHIQKNDTQGSIRLIASQNGGTDSLLNIDSSMVYFGDNLSLKLSKTGPDEQIKTETTSWFPSAQFAETWIGIFRSK